MESEFIHFRKRLNSFIDKYYKNLLIKGFILFVVLVSSIVLLVSILEYYSWFNYSTRFFLFGISAVSIIFIFYYYIAIPFFRFFGLLNRITDYKTAKIIQDKLPEIKDNVQNIIELEKLDINKNDAVLLNAALNQKIQKTKIFEFNSIINNNNLKPLFKYFVSILLVYIITLIFKPEVIIQGSNRVIHFNKEFIKNIGFYIIIDENELTVEKGKDLRINVLVKGDNVPNHLSIFFGNTEFLLHKIDNRSYFSIIKNINSDFSFRIGNDSFNSKLYNINVINRPFIIDYKISAFYPDYTKKENKIFHNISNLKLPLGTKLLFELNCEFVDSLWLKVINKRYYFAENRKNYSLEFKLNKSIFYSIKGKNLFLDNELVTKSFLTVIPDLYPEIEIQKISDKTNKRIFYFKGIISDDYGLSNLVFNMNGDVKTLIFNKNLTKQEFYFTYEFDEKTIDQATYFFEVFDNDMINGVKSTKSNMYYFKKPNYFELAQLNEKEKNDIIEKMEKSILLANEFKKDIEHIKKSLLSENLSAFERKQLFKDLSDKQKTLEDIINDFAENNKNKNNEFNSFNQQNNELLKKQQEIQNLLENVIDDELKKLLEEFEKLSNDINNNDLNNDIKKLELNYDDLAEQLERNLELLKKYEIERNLENISEELTKIGNEQGKLSKDDLNNTKTDSVLTNNIDKTVKLKKQFNQIKKSNNELSNPLKLDNVNKDFDELKKSMENSKSGKSSNKKEQKSKFQQNKEEANELADKINSMLNNNRSKENGENAEALRQILENLIYFSFNIETINSDIKQISSNSALFLDKTKEQSNLNNNFRIIRDSLYELSKRTPYLGNHINNKVIGIQTNLIDIDDFFKDKKLAKINNEQRKALEYSNDLILLLSESLKNMESQGGEGGSGQCKSKKKKPKQGKPSLSDMRKSQESMKSQLESMIKQMKEGKGKKGGKGSEQVGRMIAEQEIFQKMINDLQNSNGVGQEFAKQLNEISKLLEQNKRDLVRNQVNQNTINRQNKIVTRLLEAEKADMEREIDEKRKSSEPGYYVKSNPKELFDVEKKNINFNDILDKNSIKLNFFYKNKYQEYIKNLN